MVTIEEQVKKIKKEKRLGLMTHVIVGYPSLRKTIRLVKLMAAEGADFIELQIPFSDPLADGPTIMKACEEALAHGTKVRDAFVAMETLSSQVAIPLLFMGYYNTVFRYGVEKFCKDAKKAGAAGLIIPDMPLEEEEEEHFLQFAKKYNLPVIRVVSPASTVSRLQKNAKYAEGFVYCSARQGITGVRKDLDPHLAAYLKIVKKYIKQPLAVGFGISSPKHIKALKPHAEIAVVGSALVKITQECKGKEREQKVRTFVRSLML
ncbi:MAG TPA: tryptophan synthase subunit alpha [Patescibacteria group bacterium]|nr:tryptophan synthase subunit alpha [Patescibacteria group bacterium]